MRYEVRYMANNEEHSQIVDVDTAAEAADTVTREHSDRAESFELIQIQLLEDPSENDQALSTQA